MSTIRYRYKGAALSARVLAFLFAFIFCHTGFSQEKDKPQTDVNTPLHMLQPDYPVPYGKMSAEEIKEVLDRVRDYLETATPPKLIDSETGEEITNLQRPRKNAAFARGDFRLISYEWGVTYAAMLHAAEITGDKRFSDYTQKRLDFLAQVRPYFQSFEERFPEAGNPFHSVLHPRALDDAGAMCAAMIKATRAGLNDDLRPMIDNFIDYISNDQFRLHDGTLARNRPQPNTIWLDDLFMSVPALAQMGKLTGEEKYFNDAVKQVLQFAGRMFDHEKGLYMHGWVQEMEEHPEFYWARANGWAIMTKVELLSVLPEDHPGRNQVLELLRAHCRGLSRYQHGTGFWHQLIDRNDSYLETSATAIFVYSITKAMNENWVDPKVYGPRMMLAWNAITTKVNEKGQVEETCVGTGMGFDPAFYYYRPVSLYAAHGYGPVLLAGSEMIKTLEGRKVEINDSALQFYE